MISQTLRHATRCRSHGLSLILNVSPVPDNSKVFEPTGERRINEFRIVFVHPHFDDMTVFHLGGLAGISASAFPVPSSFKLGMISLRVIPG